MNEAVPGVVVGAEKEVHSSLANKDDMCLFILETHYEAPLWTVYLLRMGKGRRLCRRWIRVQRMFGWG